MGGTYTLVLERATGGPIEVGALGERQFPAGWYAYTGSALGSGGFSRVTRHAELACGERDTRHWHVDYLLGDDGTSLDEVETTAADVECAVARRVAVAGADLDALAGFGCSDCDCPSHLAYHERRERLRRAVAASHAAVTEDT